MQGALETQCVHQGVWNVLCEVQVRAAGDMGKQGTLREVLHGHDHSREQNQVPLVLSLSLCGR